MKHRELRDTVCEANREIARTGLAILTWGNASGADRAAGVMAIKPSGIAYDLLRPEDIIVLALETGARVEGEGRPSSDTPTHLYLYRAFAGVGGIVHTHSRYATVWAQAGMEIPCLGTTHADTFHGPVPLARMLTEKEVRGEYEEHTGRVIEERFREGGLDPLHVPGVLAAGHAPFAWGASPTKALEHALVLEEVARMALLTRALNPGAGSLPGYVLDKHYLRKHGPGAYYGQPA
jgi:L-ribulose-5-phosphate 4-epimerase